MKFINFFIIPFVIGCGQSSDADKYSGFETAIVCKGPIDRDLLMKKISCEGKHIDNFGSIGSHNGRDGLAVSGFSPLIVGEKLIICWGEEEDEDQIAMKHRVALDTKPFLKHKDKIKSVQYIYYGNGKWGMKAFDGPTSDDNANELIPDQPVEGVELKK